MTTPQFLSLREQAMLRVLIHRLAPSSSLASSFSNAQAKRYQTLPIESSDLTPLLNQPSHFLDATHYSWLAPLIEELPLNLRSAAVSSLSTEQIAGLKSIASPMPLPLPAKKFLRQWLYQKLEGDAHLPLEFLPEEPLSFCLEWSKTEWIQFFDFLGLYDLCSEMRQIVNRDYLKNIYTCLTPRQFHYLKICMQQKERLAFPKIGIDPSKQDCAKLKRLIHQRGLIRFGKALCAHHPDLVWHIAHRLDIGRGAILLREYSTEELAEVTTLLRQQVQHLNSFLKSEDSIQK